MADEILLGAGLILIIIGLVVIIGGVYPLKVKRWGWSVAGGICATLASLILEHDPALEKS
jgi:hypothetical protein